MITNLETKRLHLIPVQATDLDYFCQLDTDPEVMRYIGPGLTKTREETEEWLRTRVNQFDNGLGMWSVFRKEDNAFIGTYTLRYLDNTREIEMGYRYLKTYWGKGYATECSKEVLRYGMEELGFSRIVAVTDVRNKKSMQVLKKVGFQFEKKAWHYQSEVNYFAIEKD